MPRCCRHAASCNTACSRAARRTLGSRSLGAALIGSKLSSPAGKAEQHPATHWYHLCTPPATVHIVCWVSAVTRQAVCAPYDLA
jgi:hypothetical protein